MATSFFTRLRSRWVFAFLLALLCLSILSLFLTLGWVRQVTAPYRTSEEGRTTHRRVALVFGAGVRANGSLTPMLHDRMQAAVDLYKRGSVQKLLLSGDNGRADYNEVAAMRHYAEVEGVPEADITLDYAGFSTYESCYRAKVIFGVHDAVLITQAYHLPRAIYTCRMLGIEADGLGLPDWQRYPDLHILYGTRELLATTKAWWQLHFTHPLPTYLGQYEGVR